ncbi:M14 family metallopeptidase, partial [Aegicerativicinus sediminis]
MKNLFSLVIFITINFCLGQNISSPSEFLGYELGSEFTRHHRVIDYFKEISETLPGQVVLKQYGSTYEGRPLYVAIISSSKNIGNLEQIRRAHMGNTGIMENTGNDFPIVWLSYNVHGNEASSTEASMLTLYKLLTEKTDWLENVVVIIDPCINPDGRDRYVNWYNQTRNHPYSANRNSSEHREPWPGGRPNHYLFDLNRDWVWASQIETQARLKIYNDWMPHIHVDFHEQYINDPYYFAPAAEPFHENITDWQREFQTIIGKNHAKYFDQNGWLYFTRERFDLLYPSYGDTYPTFMGAIGMTYEQAGHGLAGLGINNDEGIELTLKDRLLHHTVTGLSTVEMAVSNAPKMLSEFKQFFSESVNNNLNYVLHGDSDKINSL